MEWATFKTNNESKNPELTFIEVFRLASIQVGCAATRLQSEVALREKPGQATPEGAALTAVDLAAQDVILRLSDRRGPNVVADSERTAARILGALGKVMSS